MKKLKKFFISLIEFFGYNKKVEPIITDDNSIVTAFTDRLSKIKRSDHNPYKIEKSTIRQRTSPNHTDYPVTIYTVEFDDTPFEILYAKSNTSDGFSEQTCELLSADGFIKSGKDFIKIKVQCVDEWVTLIPDDKHLKQLFGLLDEIYELVIQFNRVNKVKSSFNPVADLL
jgi:hypothetical protein